MREFKWINFDLAKVKYKKEMTYIIGGKFKGDVFLLVDSIEGDDSGSEEKTEKIKRSLVNKDAYWSMAGNPVLLELVKGYEIWSLTNGVDYEVDEDFMKKILFEFEKTMKNNGNKEFGTHVIFYIEENTIKCFKIFYKNDNLRTFKLEQILDNHFVFMSYRQQKLNINSINLIENFCKMQFFKKREEESGIMMDQDFFKDNLSFFSYKDGLRLNDSLPVLSYHEMMDSYR